MPPRHRCDSCRTAQRYCDQRRPKCSRCIARSVECTYADTERHRFVDQNNFSAELSRRAASSSRGKRASWKLNLGALPSAPPQVHHGKVPEHQMKNVYQSFMSLIDGPPSWTLDDRVLNRFMARWATGNTCLGSQSFVLDVYRSAGGQSAMNSAITAVAYADLAVDVRHGEFATRSFQAYHKTIHRMQNDLQALSVFAPHGRDELLTAILTLDSLEILYVRRPTPLGIHTHAITQLLQLKLQQSPYDQQTIALFRATTPRIQARYILSNEPYLESTVRALAEFANGEMNIRIAVFIADVCKALRRTGMEVPELDIDEINTQHITQSVDAPLDILCDMEDWLNEHSKIDFPRRVSYKVQEKTELPFPFLRTSILVFDRVWMARDWILFHMCRMKILNYISEQQVHSIVNDDNAPSSDTVNLASDTQKLKAQISESSNFLIEIIPFLIGLADKDGSSRSVSPFVETGLLVAQYPLWMILQSNFATEEARCEAFALLGYIKTCRTLRPEM